MPAILGVDTETKDKVLLGDEERRSGLYVLGKPGMGKSALLVNLILQDRENEHGVFFLDPHGDAISDCVRRKGIFGQGGIFSGYMSDTCIFLDPENETYSFGINPLFCPDITSLKERVATYTKAYNVFHKLWEEEWGVWMQLVIQHALYVLIEAPEYTLSGMPLFLTNADFRAHVLAKVKYAHDSVDFWRLQFQPKQAEAALSRVTTLLGHPYVKHIVGQIKTTLDFHGVMDYEFGKALLIKLSANLAPDIKKFIGTLIISELLHAVRARPEDKRTHFCIFVDEFQNFATDDFATLITEARKFGVATTIAHQERYGQFGENQKILGATSAAANKVFFQLTVKDARELAPEFAQTPRETEKRREPELLLSIRPAEDIWERGHPNKTIMEVRNRYLRLVDLLRSNPQEKYFEFDPRHIPHASADNSGNLHIELFNDWGAYRSSATMLKTGINVLNGYYLLWMHGAFQARYTESDFAKEELEMILVILKNLGGVLGFRPVMWPRVPEAKRQLLIRAIRRHDIELYKDLLQQTRDTYREGRTGRPQDRFWEEKGDQEEAKIRQKIIDLETGGLDHYDTHTPRRIHPKDVPDFIALAVKEGLSSTEAENLVEWEIREQTSREKELFKNLVKVFVNMEGADFTKAAEPYIYFMAYIFTQLKFGEKYPDNAATREYSLKLAQRVSWQVHEMATFILLGLRETGRLLQQMPLRVPSGHYEETLRVERTQTDLIAEMAQELAGLPRFTAYAKLLQKQDGEQVVQKQKIQTLPLPPVYTNIFAFPNLHFTCEQIATTIHSAYSKERKQIEEEISKRQESWQTPKTPTPKPQMPLEKSPPTQG